MPFWLVECAFLLMQNFGSHMPATWYREIHVHGTEFEVMMHADLLVHLHVCCAAVSYMGVDTQLLDIRSLTKRAQGVAAHHPQFFAQLIC